ncbi:MAG: UDP-N-acetylglucosamine 1-carboxyvinyltransferase [Eubacteriales bacterium]|nr:UDP-N-acetylglucosamine 1-carboxyvinyltransferase [Eubacteriales bacterium]
MSSFVVEGGQPLSGVIRIHGAKNAALPILAAALLADAPVHLVDCPHLLDVENMLRILRALGCKAVWQSNALLVDSRDAACHEIPAGLAKELRSSIFLLGPMLARFGRAVATSPGGCEIGLRPIDLHLLALEALGAVIEEHHGCIDCKGEALRGADVHLGYPSVGATENAMMAATAAVGETHIYNAACEPEIVDLAAFLNTVGCKVEGAGSSVITILGRAAHKSAAAYTHRILPDRIVAGTYLCAAAVTGGTLRLENVCREHLLGVTAKLEEAGCVVSFPPESVLLQAPPRPRQLKLVETAPYPGFPTDMQAQLFAVCAIAGGVSIIVENVFENRFKHVPELCRMGADITVRGSAAVIRGVERLTAAEVEAKDLRGGAALVIAGLAAKGTTKVKNAEHIDRGYEAMERDLCAAGARIVRGGE